MPSELSCGTKRPEPTSCFQLYSLMNPAQEVVITGVGVVAPNGVGIEDFWQALVSGRSGVALRERFEDVDLPHRIGAAVKNFAPKKYIKQRKSLKIMCGPIQFGCAAAAMAASGSRAILPRPEATKRLLTSASVVKAALADSQVQAMT